MAKTFSFPYGAYDKLTLAILKELGYKSNIETENNYLIRDIEEQAEVLIKSGSIIAVTVSNMNERAR